MESQPQNPEFRNNPDTFTHASFSQAKVTRSTSFHTQMQVDLAPLARQDVFAYAADKPLRSVHINVITKHKFILFHLFNCIGNVKILIHRKIEHYIRLSDIII